MGLVDLARRAHIAFNAPRDDGEVEAALGSYTVDLPSIQVGASRIIESRSAQEFSRETALTIPTIRRARNLHCALAGSLPLTYWRKPRVVTDEPTALEPLTWFDRPDPNKTLTWMLSWTVDDLIWWEKAYWLVTERFAPTTNGLGFPAAFKRIKPCDVQVTTRNVITVVGYGPVASDDIVCFEGTGDGVLCDGWRVIATALRLDAAAARYADVDLPSGFIQQTEGEPMNQDELTDIADAWEAARKVRRTAALPTGLEFHAVNSDPEALQLIEGRQHSALECARLMSVPPWSVGAGVINGGMTYQNAQQARADLIDFGTRRYLDVIEDTLSGPNVTPRGTFVKFDLDEWLSNPFNDATPSGAPQNRAAGDTPNG